MLETDGEVLGRFCFNSLQNDVLPTFLVTALKQKSYPQMVWIDQTHLQTADMRRVGRTEICNVDKIEIDNAFREIDLPRLQSGLVLGPAKMSHPQVGAVKMVNARHNGSVFHD